MLLLELKDYLKITWDDEDITLEDYLKRGKSELDALIGIQLDYSLNIEKGLLFDYCRYLRNNCVELFETNFSANILRLQLTKAIEVKNNEVKPIY